MYPPRSARLERSRRAAAAESKDEARAGRARTGAGSPPDAPDETARSVLGIVLAMEHAVALGAVATPLRLRAVLEIHRHLMLPTTAPEIAGKLRDRQNWMGGNAFNPGVPTSSRPRPSG